MSDFLETLASIAMAIGVGIASAVIPVVNAEVAVSTAGLTLSVWLALAISIAVAVGQTLGKICLFEAARKAAQLKAKRHACHLQTAEQHLVESEANQTAAAPAHKPKKPTPEWQRRLIKRLDGRWQTNGVVLLSAGLGLPPLAIVSIAAGAVQSRRLDFAACCLTGRTLRFLTVTLSALFIAS